LPDLKKNGTRVNIKRVIEDGDYVAIHEDLEFFGHKVGFTIFRFENGKIVEHWDNTQQRPTATISGRTMTDGPTEIKDLEKTQANKRLVQDFLQDRQNYLLYFHRNVSSAQPWCRRWSDWSKQSIGING
jgi:hypothetical protein